MDDDCDKDIYDGDVGSAEDSQVLSNITCTLQDPIHAPCEE
jgi:hypothetical protein